MRPLRLTLDAVGPYPGREVIDFRTAIESRLFGIYGPTGAGKSTIFSAMTFALFGEAAKSEQHASTLRSDHADPARTTEVEFIFESRGHTYRIVRRPEQMRPAKRGGGETKDAHKAALFDITGLDLATISEARPGKVIAETKVEAVNKEIVRLLGYGPAQFRQIVLLPQGRFETFLAANTNDRLSILRELFDVSLYQRLTEQLKSEAYAAENEIRTARDVCARRLKAEGFDTFEALADAVLAAEEDLARQRTTAEAAKTAAEQAKKIYEAAALTDKAFAQHVDAERAFTAVVAQRDGIDVLRERIKRAYSAQRLSDAEQAVHDGRDQVQAKQELSAQAARVLQNAEAEALKAADLLKTLAEGKAENERHEDELERCERYAERIQASSSRRDAVAKAMEKATADRDRAEKSERSHKLLTDEYQRIGKQLEAARNAQFDRATLRSQELLVNHALNAAKQFERARSQIDSDRSALERLNAEAEAAREKFDAQQTVFDNAEAALIQNHALHVAAHLVDGEPCPACGSRNHPSPARGSSEDSSLAERYRREKAALEHTRKAADEARSAAATARDGLTRREQEFADLLAPEHTAKALEDELNGIKNAIVALGSEIDIDALSAKRSDLESAVAASIAKLKTDQDAARASDKIAALELQSLEETLRDIPPELRDIEALAEKRGALADRIAAYAAELKKAQTDERDANDALIIAGANAQNARDNAKQAADHLEAILASFAQRLGEAGLTEQSYPQSKADISRIAEFEERMRAYDDALSRADESLRTAAAAIANVDRPDIKALMDAKDEAEAALSDANDRVAAQKARLNHLKGLAAEVSDELARLDRLEQDTGPLRELGDAFTGRNAMNMTLETFAIATMFDHVLEAANLRLGPMSRGRFALVRETEGRGNARRGLGLSIDDTYTGRQRPVNTLSGGETFIAALALALGLSDVVESTRGNIRLDTIFIDEGFGSLDAESDTGTLEQVLETLQDLVGRNRAVGIISHVPLVQQAIPNGFWISKTANGSHIEMRA